MRVTIINSRTCMTLLLGKHVAAQLESFPLSFPLHGKTSGY